MTKCSFCHNNISPGTGKMYVKKDTKVLYFCSNKCEKNMIKLGRNPRTTRWTAEYAKVKQAGAAAEAQDQ
ncbi:50S ribosomal protein L24e [Candidatus Woesearchaeota archaeon]|nr:50S ribosomal protein L24e [Candidatus Woesearchaeota archaeon]